MRYLDMCQVGSAFVNVVFAQRLTLTSSAGGNKRLKRGWKHGTVVISSCFALVNRSNCTWQTRLTNVCVKHILMQILNVIIYLDYALWCKLRTIPFRLSQFPNAADLLSCNRSAFPLHACTCLGLQFSQFSL